MNKKPDTTEWDGIEKRKSLRSMAESMVAGVSPDDIKAQPNEILLHELLVHKVELEMQNEELRKAHLNMEEARDRYWHLYEFAPVGYITVTREAMISQINLTACSMLNASRSKIINRRFPNCIVPSAQNHWHRMFLNIMQQAENDRQTFDLEMLRDDGTTFYAHLDCLKLTIVDSSPLLRISLTDISKIKQAEADLSIAAIVFESKEPMMVTDAENKILRVNQAFTKNTGYEMSEVVGQKPSFLKSGNHQYDFYNAMWESIHQTGHWEGGIWNKRKNGEIYSEWLRITAVTNDSGDVTNFVGIFSNSTDTQKS
ncbi:MAG: PAS domain S-box protein [Methylophilaceae bacterium]|nr:PAS domain S-box protein [Methylophilaceae bacterium]